jgi:hypothetical protein
MPTEASEHETERETRGAARRNSIKETRMFKLSLVAAVITAAISMAPIPVVTGPAVAQPLGFAAPNNPKLPRRSTYTRHNELGYLRRVYEEELDLIHDANRVWVTLVCMVGLRHAPAAKATPAPCVPTLPTTVPSWTRYRKNFRPDDVVGIRMTGDDAVIIYVHLFHH